MSNSRRFRILQRDNFKCAYCGKVVSEAELEVDHIMPRSKGGSNEETNLITACFECNRGKRDKVLIENNKQSNVNEIEMLALEAHSKENRFRLKSSCIIGYFLDAIDNEIELTVKGKAMLKSYARKYDEDLICECIEISVERYLTDYPSGYNYSNVLKKIGGILHNKTKTEE